MLSIEFFLISTILYFYHTVYQESFKSNWPLDDNLTKNILANQEILITKMNPEKKSHKKFTSNWTEKWYRGSWGNERGTTKDIRWFYARTRTRSSRFGFRSFFQTSDHRTTFPRDTQCKIFTWKEQFVDTTAIEWQYKRFWDGRRVFQSVRSERSYRGLATNVSWVSASSYSNNNLNVSKISPIFTGSFQYLDMFRKICIKKLSATMPLLGTNQNKIKN